MNKDYQNTLEQDNLRTQFRKVSRRSLKDWYNIALYFVSGFYYRFAFMQQYPETYSVIRHMKNTHALYAGDYKYIHLHRLLDAFQPKSILEFGSGSSTAVFATFAQQTGARVCTVEDSAEWQDNTKRVLGNKADAVEFVLASSETIVGSPNRCFYQFRPSQAFDFVYVDGPPLVINGQHDPSTVNWNVIEMINSGLYPKYIVIDVRKSTVNYIAENFPNEYTPHFREKAKHQPLNYRYHSYFVRR